MSGLPFECRAASVRSSALFAHKGSLPTAEAHRAMELQCAGRRIPWQKGEHKLFRMAAWFPAPTLK